MIDAPPLEMRLWRATAGANDVVDDGEPPCPVWASLAAVACGIRIAIITPMQGLRAVPVGTYGVAKPGAGNPWWWFYEPTRSTAQ